MFGIFMESLVIFKLYTGLKFLILLFAVSWAYLLLTEKDKRIRLMFVYAPVLILLLFLCPISRKAFVAVGLDGETYYRILWTIPMGVITVYAMCRLFGKHKRIGLVVTAGMIMACGSYVYSSPYISKAENLYHIPDEVVAICDMIKPAHEDAHVMVVVPEELVYYVRQYNANIKMPYGREMIASQWDYYDKVHAAMEETEEIVIADLVDATREVYCQYIVLSPTRLVEGDPADYGLQMIGNIDGYRLYKDPVTAAVVEEWDQYYEEE